MAVGFMAIAAVALVAGLFAFDPQDHVPDVAILAPAGISICAAALAAIGGRVAVAVSGVLGVLLVAGAAWTLSGAEPSEWVSSRLAGVMFAGTVGVACVGTAAVVLAVRGEVSLRHRRATASEAGVAKSGRAHMATRLKLLLSWVIVAALVAIAVGTGWWWFRANVLFPSCGPVADAQIRDTMNEMSSRIPGLRFTDVTSSCDSVWTASAVWEHDDAQQLLADALAAGCTVNERGLSEDGDEDLLICTASGRQAVFTVDRSGDVEIGGSMSMA